jgi:hypothetical protein
MSLKRGQLQLPTAPLTTLSKAGAAALAFDGASLQASINGGAYLPIQTAVTAAAGPVTAVQFNTGGAFAGDASFTFDVGTGTLAVPGVQALSLEPSGINNLFINTVAQSRTVVGADLQVDGTVLTTTVERGDAGALVIGGSTGSATTVLIGSGASVTNLTLGASTPVTRLRGASTEVADVAGQDLMLGNSTGDLAFFGGAGGPQPTVTGSAGGNAALQSLLTELATLGLIVDGSS